jgi:phosphoribosyl 1,2-cyclic phosphodiesterase
MRIKFWGVRGSYPVPGLSTNRYGGNTSCVQVKPRSGEQIVLDAGTGIRKLGKEMMAGPFGQGRGTCHLLISHTHWDHIQGLPFFAPLYVGGNSVILYARQRDIHLRTLFGSQTEAPYFPVSLEEAAAQVSYAELLEGSRFEIGTTRVRCAPQPPEHRDRLPPRGRRGRGRVRRGHRALRPGPPRARLHLVLPDAAARGARGE